MQGRQQCWGGTRITGHPARRAAPTSFETGKKCLLAGQDQSADPPHCQPVSAEALVVAYLEKKKGADFETFSEVAETLKNGGWVPPCLRPAHVRVHLCLRL